MKKLILFIGLCITFTNAQEIKTTIKEMPFQLIYSIDKSDDEMYHYYIGSQILKGKITYIISDMDGPEFSFVIDDTELDKLPMITQINGNQFKTQEISLQTENSIEMATAIAKNYGMPQILLEDIRITQQECKIIGDATIHLASIKLAGDIGTWFSTTGDMIRLIDHGQYEIICPDYM